MDDKVSSSSEKFRVTTKTLNKKKDTLVLVFRLISFPSEQALGRITMIKRGKTREEREEDRRSQTTVTKERERERANGSLSAFTHFFS